MEKRAPGSRGSAPGDAAPPSGARINEARPAGRALWGGGASVIVLTARGKGSCISRLAGQPSVAASASEPQQRPPFPLCLPSAKSARFKRSATDFNELGHRSP